MSATISGTDLLGRLSHDAQQELAEGEASVHHLTGKSEAVRTAWHSVGVASVRLRNEAMRIAGTNQPVGKGYNQIWKALSDTKPGLRDLAKWDRAHAMWLADHWSLVNAWLHTLASNEALTLLHPTSIKRKYEAGHKPPAASANAPSARVGLQDQVIKLQAEVDMLRKKGGGGLLPGASVSEFTDLLFEAHNPDFVRRMLAEAGKRLAAEERQDAIEAKRKRKGV